MRTIACLFFAVSTLLLGNIRAGVGQPGDAAPALAAFVFVIAAGRVRLPGLARPTDEGRRGSSRRSPCDGQSRTLE